MITLLEGKLAHIDLKFAVLSTNGVGYKVYTTDEILEKISHDMGNVITLWIHTSVREDALDLYGFLSKRDLDFFEHLISVSGIGPKSALAILNGSSTDTLIGGIASGDASHLTKISGIGKKSAEKIILELKDKFKDAESQSMHTGGNKEGHLAIDALVSLGYGERESRETVREITKHVSNEATSQHIVKEALKMLSKK